MSARRIVLVTSGMGNAFGGIGVVTEQMLEALRPMADTVSVWRNPLERGRLARAVLVGGSTLDALAQRPELLVYEHVDLARLSVVTPWLRNIPYAVFLHGTELWRPLDRMRRAALIGARLLIANSAFTARVAREHNPWLPRVEVAWLGVRPVRESAVEAERPPVTLIVGRMDAGERRKGHDAVLDAWPLIASKVPRVELHIVGGGDDVPRLRSRVAREALSRVEFLGRLDDDARDAQYAQSRLFFFPSTQEGFGLAGIEAAARGCPILALRGTVLEELFPDGTGAVFADNGEAEQIARAAVPVIESAQTSRVLGELAQNRVRNQFLAPHFIDRFRAIVARHIERL